MFNILNLFRRKKNYLNLSAKDAQRLVNMRMSQIIEDSDIADEPRYIAPVGKIAALQQDIIDIKRALGFPDDFPHEDLIFELERMNNE